MMNDESEFSGDINFTDTTIAFAAKAPKYNQLARYDKDGITQAHELLMALQTSYGDPE